MEIEYSDTSRRRATTQVAFRERGTMSESFEIISWAPQQEEK